MTDLNEMWRELERYQPYADKHGFGAEWRRMCEERTTIAAYIASDEALGYAAWAAYAAAWAACSAAYAARDAVDAKEESSASWAQRAIKDIREAIELEEKT